MCRQPTRFTLTNNMFTDTTHFRSHGAKHSAKGLEHHVVTRLVAKRPVPAVAGDVAIDKPGIEAHQPLGVDSEFGGGAAAETLQHDIREIGRAHVRIPVTNAHLVCRLLLEKKNKHFK